MGPKSSSWCAAILLICATLTLTSCSESFVYNKPVTHNGFGPPAHAPAHGYRRKHGQTVVVSSSPAIVGTVGKTSKGDANGKYKTELAIAGVAAAGGAVYGVVNERDKKQTQVQTQTQLEQISREMNVVTVNVTNSNGSVSLVRLRKQGIGYIGPKGEYYDHLPTDQELRPTYALKSSP